MGCALLCLVTMPVGEKMVTGTLFPEVDRSAEISYALEMGTVTNFSSLGLLCESTHGENALLYPFYAINAPSLPATGK
jgi:hypothetical protein